MIISNKFSETLKIFIMNRVYKMFHDTYTQKVYILEMNYEIYLWYLFLSVNKKSRERNDFFFFLQVDHFLE